MNVVASVIQPVASFGRGFGYLFRAPGFLLRHPGLLRFVAIPFTINLVIFSLAVYFGLDLFNHLLEQYLPQGEAWYLAMLYYLAWVPACKACTTPWLRPISVSAPGRLCRPGASRC